MQKYGILFMISLISCVDSVELTENREVNLLVIEGGITTESGPHLIKLTRGARYGDVFAGTIAYETGADVFVRDDLGNTYILNEQGQGEYVSSRSLKGEIGRSYTLIIETSEGTEYQSTPQLLTSVSPLDSVYFEHKEIDNVDGTTTPGIDIIVQFEDDAAVTNYYKWESVGTHSLETRPDLYIPPGPGGEIEPKDCCAVCYKSEVIEAINISSDRLYNGNKTEKTIAFIIDDGIRFSEKYVIEISQISISRDAFLYYDLLINQLSISGDIFDPPPATIRGNMINITNPNEEVVGFFRASDVQYAQFEVWGVELPELEPVPLIPDDCREVRGATTSVPDFW